LPACAATGLILQRVSMPASSISGHLAEAVRSGNKKHSLAEARECCAGSLPGSQA
jgi:hypothetical protein